LARPGGNATGLMNQPTGLAGKRLAPVCSCCSPVIAAPIGRLFLRGRDSNGFHPNQKY
jgi:hypothetical protein